MDHRAEIDRARELRSNMSRPEVLLWQRIRRDLLGFRVKRQQPYSGYYLDFYISSIRVAIEVDGQIHGWQIEHDERRDTRLETYGMVIIRIPARRIFEDIDAVVEYLALRLEEIAEDRRINPLPKLPRKSKKKGDA